MAGEKRYVVDATQIVVKVPGAQGGEVYMRRGRVLPSSVTSAEIKRLRERELIRVAEDAEVPASTSSTADGSTGGPTKPRGNAGLDKFTEYAVAQGITVPDGADLDAVKALIAAAEAEAQR